MKFPSLSELCSALLAVVSISQAASQAPWQSYIVGPETGHVVPSQILSTSGNVTNAPGLLPNGTSPATLSRPSSSDTPPNITIDFGLNTVGYLQIAFSGASENVPGLRIAFSETTEFMSNRSDFTRSDNGDAITPGTDQVAVISTAFNWTDSHGCQHDQQVCADGLHGFRYVSIVLDALDTDSPYTQPNGTISISSVSLQYTGFLGTESTYQGWFECSDTQLNQFWYAASYTNDMITDTFLSSDCDPRDAANAQLEGTLVLQDGAKRDRDPYAGDVAVSGITTYLTHGDQTSPAAGNVLANLAEHQRSDGWIPPASINDYTLSLFDYPLWWVFASWDFILYSDNATYASSYYPNLVAVLDIYYPSNTDNATGLLTRPAGYGNYAFLPRDGIVTYYNALYVLALQRSALWAAQLGENSTSSKWLARVATVSDAVNNNLFDASAGAYYDTLPSADPDTHPQDGNALSILSGIANSTQASSAIAYLDAHTSLPYGNAFTDTTVLASDGPDRVYAFLSSFDITARLTTGHAASAIDQIRRLYGWMYEHDPGITMWEGISTDGTPYEGAYTSMAHGWSTGVVGALTGYVLGAQITGIGGKTWSVKPVVAGTNVTWAQGVLPTAYGGLSVSWEIDASGVFQLVVDAPAGTSGDVAVPASSENVTVSVDGETAWTNGTSMAYGASFAEQYVNLQGLGSGEHNITVSDPVAAGALSGVPSRATSGAPTAPHPAAYIILANLLSVITFLHNL